MELAGPEEGRLIEEAESGKQEWCRGFSQGPPVASFRIITFRQRRGIDVAAGCGMLKAEKRVRTA